MRSKRCKKATKKVILSEFAFSSRSLNKIILDNPDRSKKDYTNDWFKCLIKKGYILYTDEIFDIEIVFVINSKAFMHQGNTVIEK